MTSHLNYSIYFSKMKFQITFHLYFYSQIRSLTVKILISSMLLIVSIIITAELYSTFKYHMKIGETTRCCSFFLRTHVKISYKISIIEFNIQIKWCIIVTPSREAEKDYQGYFNSPPHKKNHIATPMINTVLFKISTHIITKRMTVNHPHRLRYNFNSHPHEEDDGEQRKK